MKRKPYMGFRKLISAVILFVVPALLLSQQVAWTRDECIGYAPENNISANQKSISNQLLDITQEQYKAVIFPTLNGSASQCYNFGRSIDPYTNDYFNQNLGSSSFSLNSSLVLFSGFQVWNGIRQGEVDQRVGELDLEQAGGGPNPGTPCARLMPPWFFTRLLM